jgi:PST family polysaccharide transporter
MNHNNSTERPIANKDSPSSHRDRERHFDTDHLLTDLESRTVSGSVITVSSQVIQFVLTLASTMALARLLTPSDFGLVAMVWTIMGFLRIFKDAGLSTATVQREGITHTQVSNLFWVNVMVSGIATVLVAACAPLIAWFYQEPRLVGVTLALSANFLLAGLAVQHTALLSRQMRFMTIAIIQVGSLLAGVLVGVVMAWMNYGYWSLVGLSVTTNLIALLMTWCSLSWHPQFFRRNSGTRSLLHFGANLTAGTFIYSLARGLDGILIGRFCGAAPLGLYTRAAALLARPMDQFIAPIQAVVIPAFSRLQADPKRYRQNFIHLYEGITLASFFITGMFFALARPLTLVVLGQKWENATIIFAALSFAALQTPLGYCAGWLINSQGRGKDSFFAAWINSINVAISFLVGLPFGPAGVAISFSASSLLIQNPIYFGIAGRSGPVSAKDLWTGFLKHLPVWGIVTLTAWLTLVAVHDFRPLAQLAVCIPSALLGGITFIFIYPPSRRVADVLTSTLRELINRSKTTEMPVNSQVNQELQSSLTPGISVIIPTFNRKRLLKRAIESALNQTSKPDQIIVVDDGSTDDTYEMCRQFSGVIEYVYQTNAGVAQARNHGIKLARHAWIAFLDSDDYWAPTHLASITTAIRETAGQARFYFSDLVHLVDEIRPATLWSEIGFKFDGFWWLSPDATDWMLSHRVPASIQSSVFQAALLKSSGGFDPRFQVMEDTELFCRLGIGGAACAVNAVGCFYSADDSPDNRLTTKVNFRTENYWICTCRLWRLVYSHFPHLSAAHQEIIRCYLANSYWRLTRNRWNAGKFLHAVRPLFQCLKTEPSFPVTLLWGKANVKQEKARHIAPEPILEGPGSPIPKHSATGNVAQPSVLSRPAILETESDRF